VDAVHRFDQALFDRVARARTPLLDEVLPPLTRAADHSKLWMAVAGALWLSGSRFRRRAALRGMLAVGLTSAVANGPVKWFARRRRPSLDPVPLHRWIRRAPRTTSFPSGHTASAFAFATGVAMEQPVLAAPLAPVAAAVGLSRVHAGVHYPLDVLAGAALGAGLGLATARWWPVAPHEPARARALPPRHAAEPLPEGAGLTVVVNPAAGPALAGSPAAELRDGLPAAEVVEVDDPAELSERLAKAAATARALGVAGGDGTVGAAATVALEHGLPLAVVPAGTLNHLARDLGLSSVADAVEAVRDGEVVAVDAGEIDGRVFLNTASIGSYPELVDMRERWESRIGKWPALALALVRVLSTAEPLAVEIDGRRRRIWMAFVGNCRYHPSGFGPSWRERLDDGHLDVRIVDATHPFARTRLVLSILAGRLGRSQVYEQRLARSLSVRCLGGPCRLARDGETFDSSSEFTIRKRSGALRTYVPARSS
jgi:diacylglycerol kinase family enzyme/membrane-associated phospholipid phosphatase